MSSFAKLAAVLCAAIYPLGVLAGSPAERDRLDPEARAEKKATEEKGTARTDGDSPDRVIDVPVPMGHDAKGLKIPYFTSDGRRQMIFSIDVASRIDEKHIRMSGLRIQTFDEAGEDDLSIDLPTSVMDLITSVISTDKFVRIKRVDFELTGHTMQFNTKTRRGSLGGKVKMVIHNLEDQTVQAPAVAGPSILSQPQTK